MSKTLNIDDAQRMTSDKSMVKESTIEMRDDDTLQVQMSIDDANIIASLSPRITVTFYNVSKIINVPAKMIDPSSKERFIQRTLLDKVSGEIHSGQLVALMGPLDCGKTTLLNTLPARALNGVSDDIWFNNQKYDKTMKRKLDYVLQQDLFFENLTVNNN